MRKYAMIFPGQASQYVGMGKNLYDSHEAARKIIDRADEVLGRDIKRILFDGTYSELSKISNSLVAVYIVSVAAFRVFWDEIGVAPVISAGHSLGEFTALTCCGALEFDQTLSLIQLRSELAEPFMHNGMMSVINKCDTKTVESACREGGAYVGCYNSPDQFIISGNKAGVIKAGGILANKGAQVTPLLFSPPFHCPLMNNDIITGKIKQRLETMTVNLFRWPVLANLDCQSYSKENIIDNLTSQISKPVRWVEITEKMSHMGVDCFIEIGPQTVLTELINRYIDKKDTYSFFNQKGESGQIRNKITGYNRAAHKRMYEITIITKCLSTAVTIKNKNNDLDAYQRYAVEPYNKIKEIQQMIMTNGLSPTREQNIDALSMLISVMKTKGLDKDESVRMITEILSKLNQLEEYYEFIKMIQ